MKKMKRFLAATLAAVTLAISFAGCGNKSEYISFDEVYSSLTGGIDFSAWKWVLKEAVMEGSKVVTPEVAVNYGNLIAVILDFIIIAFAVFCMVKAINKMHDKLSKPAEPEPEKAPEPTKEEVLLTEIRDLLKEQSK